MGRGRRERGKGRVFLVWRTKKRERKGWRRLESKG